MTILDFFSVKQNSSILINFSKIHHEFYLLNQIFSVIMSYIVLSVHRFHQFCEYVRLFFLFSSHLFFRTLKSKLHLSLPLKRKPFKIISKKILLHVYKFISSYSFYSQSQKNELFFFIIESWIILYWILNYLYFFLLLLFSLMMEKRATTLIQPWDLL